jgi:hypothetical protein
MRPVVKRVLACLLVFLASTPVALADDLVAKRASCLELARDRINTRGRTSSDIYRVIVERRRTFVQKCMAENGSSDAEPRQSHDRSS